MSSLGFHAKENGRKGNGSAHAVFTPTPLPAPTATRMSCSIPVIKGFLPMLFYSCLAGFVAIAYNYLTFDDMPMASTLAAGILALSLVLGNDPAVWFNMALFYYIGLEVRVLDQTLDFINTADTNLTVPDGAPSADKVEDRALAWAAFVTIIVHLVPFLILDRRGLLSVLAAAGAVVNTALIAYLKLPSPVENSFHETYTLLLLSASLGLLVITLFSIRMKCSDCSLLSHLRRTLREGGWLTVVSYEM